MECPRCGSTEHWVRQTKKLLVGVVRTRECGSKEDPTLGCGLVFKTIEVIEEVRVFNHSPVKSEMVDLSIYKEKHLKKELDGLSGFQHKMF